MSQDGVLNEPTAQEDKTALPVSLRRVYGGSLFLSRLPLHTGHRIGVTIDRWAPLADWWRQTQGSKGGVLRALHDQVIACAPAMERDVKTLGEWAPPENPLPDTAFGDLYVNLAAQYIVHREDIAIRRCAPGPLEGSSHPGFDFSYDATRARFEARERSSPLLGIPLRFAFVLPLSARTRPHFEENAFEPFGQASFATDAWELFALRAVLIALHDCEADAVRALEVELGRPVWDHVLEQLDDEARKSKAPREGREWAFSLTPTYRDGQFKLVAYSRRALQNGKLAKWKESLETLYAEDDSNANERDIARVALCSTESTGESRFQLGTPQAHELLRLLAQHGNVTYSPLPKPDPSADPRAEIVAGDLALRLEPGVDGVLVPRFLIDGKEIDGGALRALSNPGIHGASAGARIASARVGPALRPWLATAQRVGSAFTFPPDAVPKLLTSTQALRTAGSIELPRTALGTELGYDPTPALRVEWNKDGVAVVHIFITVSPHAPMVAAGKGPVLFTFEENGQRVFVERDLAREKLVALEARARIEAPLRWDDAIGHTEGLPDTLELAEYLDRNPLGLAIEIKIGTAPKVTAWADAKRDIDVSKKGAWLHLDGKLDVQGIKLTLGDVLDAARLAQRFVRAADGVFLELSQEAIDKLRPVAIAAELAGTKAGEVPRLHDAFGSILAQAKDLFETSSGIDIEAITKRFEARDVETLPPSLEHGTLRHYQSEGVAWMLQLATWAPGCILADDMGLGKTVQTAAVLQARAALGPQLIVAPASVTSNWMAELARFVPSISARWFNDDPDLVPAILGKNDVLVVSYGLLQRRAALFETQRWTTVVIDEAQYVKNVTAQRTDTVRNLQRDFTIALTGTPLENHVGELFSIADLAFPGLLGDEPTFREKFRRPIEGQRDEVKLAVLARLLGPFLLRRTRATVLQELPPREEITEYIDLAPPEQKRYLALRKACEAQFAKRKKEETAAQLKIALFAALTRLRQLACDVSLVDPSYDGPSTKIARAVELATQLASEGNRALVFSQFTTFLTKLQTAFEAAGLRVAYLAGDTPTTKRRALVDAFQAGEYDVFCVSLLAGGTGLNLTKASYVIHTDPWWNPAAEEQATSRAHRMGQTEPVTVYRLVARGTIEEAVLEMHTSKKSLATAVLEGKASTKAITATELIELLSFGG